MKKFSLLSLVVVLVFASTALAAGNAIPGSGWYSGEQVQNVGTGSATISATAYDSASASTYTASRDIAAGASTTFLPADFTGMPDGFQGSAVVSSNQDIRAIVNVTNRQAGDYGVAGGLAAAQYQGMNTGDTTLNFPLVKNDYYSKSTTFYIQNAGASAATAEAVFYVGTQTYNYTTPSIAPGAMASVSPADAGVPTNSLGSLKVTSTAALAGVVLEHRTTDNPATLLQSTRGFVPADSDDSLYAPIIKNAYFNRFTGLQVQNTSTTPISINVSYAAVDGCTGTFTDSAADVAPNTSYTFVHLAGSTTLPAGCLAAATVTVTGGTAVAIVNESFVSGYTGAPQASTTYSALPASAGTAKISVPLYKEDSYGKWTGLQVQNISSSPAQVVLTFTGPTGTYVSAPQTIAAGAGMTFLDVRLKAASFWNGTAMPACAASGCVGNGVFGVTVTANQSIVAIANESPYPQAATLVSQDKNNYEGFNLAP